MGRTIKLNSGASITVNVDNKIMTQQKWLEEGKKRFGEDFMNWRFVCPMCRHTASIQEFKDAGVDDPNFAYQECIGRYLGKGSPKEDDSSGCNWTSYGLFGIPNGKGIIVIDDNEMGTEVFDFAD